jgi:hypothetical protein
MLFLLAAVVACVSWTVTQEELFRESREYCKRQSLLCRMWAQRKFFYLFTCEYCFSHYIAAALIVATGYGLPNSDGLGHVVAWLALVWIANVYMSLYRLLRVGIKLIGLKAHIIEDAREAYLEQQKLKEMGEHNGQ